MWWVLRDLVLEASDHPVASGKDSRCSDSDVYPESYNSSLSDGEWVAGAWPGFGGRHIRLSVEWRVFGEGSARAQS